MKRLVYMPIALLLFLAISCSEQIDPEVEKQAIIDAINAETNAYMDLDFERITSFFVHDSLNIRLGVGADDIQYLEGWKAIEDQYRKELESEDVAADLNAHISVTKDDFKIKLYDHTAYVTCTEKWIYELGETVKEIDSRQIRFMEKIDGDWKIAFLAYIGTSGYDEESELEEMGFEFNTVPTGTGK